jgi:hypothetical protein
LSRPARRYADPRKDLVPLAVRSALAAMLALRTSLHNRP